MSWLRIGKDGAVLLTVHVQPKASRTKIAGLFGDEAVKICITAPPVDGQANEALVKFLAKLFKLPKSAVTIESGLQGRTKQFRLTGITVADAEQILTPLLALA
ncbi:MAG TPA: DUF167 family protein [Desulfurivibrionaceae bacterium]|nr:DUF167 family protein [Desulfurivibrionaceae bacterium]